MMENSPVLIEAKNLKKYFKVRQGLLHAVDDVSFQIPQGTTLGAVGESGCGKSTLGRTAIRLLEPTAGEMLYQGEDLFKLNGAALKKMRTELNIIFQDPFSSLNPRMSVTELIADPLKVNRLCSDKEDMNRRVKELMDTVGLAQRVANSYPHELDGGRRQRIGVARALAVNPKFIVCDEPVSALDVSIQAQILNLLMDLQRDMGLTYMFITHDLSVVKHISDRIMVMYMGQCVETCDSDELFANPCHPYTKALLNAIPKLDISTRKNRREIIRGEVSNPINPSPGCRFAPRCEFCTEKCTKAGLQPKEVAPGHTVRCTLYE